LQKYLMVIAGGGAGALARYVLSVAVMSWYSGRFPLGTFLINVTGSFAIGLLVTVFFDSPNVRLLLVTGFLGGYTTFSSFEFESWAAFDNGARWIGLLNLVGSVVFGYIAVWLGVFAAGKR